MRFILLLYIILNPLVFVINADLRQVQETFFQISSLIVISSGLLFENKRIKPDNMNKALGAYLLWAVALFVITNFLGFAVLWNTVLGFLVYMTVIRTIDKEDLKYIFTGALVVGILSVIYTSCQYLGFDPRGQLIAMPKGQAPQGVPDCSFFGYKAATGSYMAMITPLLACITPFALLFLIPTIFSYSSGAVLGCVIAILIFLWFRKRIVFWYSLIPLVLSFIGFFVFMDFPMGMQGTRIPMWGMVIQDASQRPFGRGWDSFRGNVNILGTTRYMKNSFNNQTQRIVLTKDGWGVQGGVSQEFIDTVNSGKHPLDFWDHPHSEPLWLYYEGGTPAVVIVGMFIYFMCMRYKRSKRDVWTTGTFCSLLAVGILSFTQFPFHLSRIAHLLPVILGGFYVASDTD